MDWDSHLQRVAARRSSARRRSSTRSRRSASTCTSATPVCSTSVRSAFLGVGAYGMAITVADVDLPSGSASSSAWSRARRARAAARHPDAAAARRLPGDRHDRRGRDRPALSTASTDAAQVDRRLGRPAGFSGDFYELNPFAGGTLRHRAHHASPTRRAVGDRRRLDARRCSRCLVVYLLMRSPWGRVLKAIREDEDAVRSLGKNVFSYKMQSLILGGVLGGLGGFVFALTAPRSSRTTTAPSSRSSRYTIVILGGAAPGPRPGRRLDDLLGAAALHRRVPARGDQQQVFPTSLMTTRRPARCGTSWSASALMLLMIFRPQGIFGDKREVMLDARETDVATREPRRDASRAGLAGVAARARASRSPTRSWSPTA